MEDVLVSQPAVPTESDEEEPPPPLVVTSDLAVAASFEHGRSLRAKEEEIAALRLETERLKRRRHTEEELNRNVNAMSLELCCTKQQLDQKLLLIQDQVLRQHELEQTAKQLLVHQKHVLTEERIAEVKLMKLKHVQLEEQACVLQEEATLLREAKHEQQQQLETLETELEAKNQALVDVSEWEVTVHKQVGRLGVDITAKEAELKMLSEVMRTLEEDKSKVERELQDAELLFASQKHLLGQTVTELHEGLSLEPASSDGSNEQSHLHEQLDEAHTAMAALESEHQSKTELLLAEQHALHDELNQMRAQKEGIMLMLCELENEVSCEFAQKQSQFDQMKRGAAEALKTKSRELAAVRRELKQEKVRAEAHEDELREAIERLEDEMDEKNEAVAVCASQLAAEIEAHASCSAVLARLCKKEAAVQKKIVEVQKQLRRETRKKDKLAAQERVVAASLEEGCEEEDAVVLRQQLADATDTIHKAEERIEQLNKEKETFLQERAVLESTRAELDVTVASLQERELQLLTEAERAEQTSIEQIEALQQTLMSAEQHTAKVETALTRAQADLERLELQSESTQVTSEQLHLIEHRNDRLEEQLLVATKQLDSQAGQLHSAIQDTIVSHQLVAESRCELEECIAQQADELQREIEGHAITQSFLSSETIRAEQLERRLMEADGGSRDSEVEQLNQDLRHAEADNCNAQREARECRDEIEVLQRKYAQEQVRHKMQLTESREKEELVQRQLNEMLQLLLQLPSDAQEALLQEKSLFPMNPATMTATSTAADLDKLRRDQIERFERTTPRRRSTMIVDDRENKLLEPKAVNAALARIIRQTPRGEANPH